MTTGVIGCVCMQPQLQASLATDQYALKTKYLRITNNLLNYCVHHESVIITLDHNRYSVIANFNHIV